MDSPLAVDLALVTGQREDMVNMKFIVISLMVATRQIKTGMKIAFPDGRGGCRERLSIAAAGKREPIS
ncbi:hypothetical protein KCP75_05755 [Salmonella enterica subsp. enterica]|nr:hypothetical protein KCP75_05755 [Salmonella enterica subsp. enterica]